MWLQSVSPIIVHDVLWAALTRVKEEKSQGNECRQCNEMRWEKEMKRKFRTFIHSLSGRPWPDMRGSLWARLFPTYFTPAAAKLAGVLAVFAASICLFFFRLSSHVLSKKFWEGGGAGSSRADHAGVWNGHWDRALINLFLFLYMLYICNRISSRFFATPHDGCRWIKYWLMITRMIEWTDGGSIILPPKQAIREHERVVRVLINY